MPFGGGGGGGVERGAKGGFEAVDVGVELALVGAKVEEVVGVTITASRSASSSGSASAGPSSNPAVASALR